MKEMSEKKPQIETVDVTISLPKKLIEFLKANEKSLQYPSVKAYIEDSFKQSVIGDIDNGVFNRQIVSLLMGSKNNE